MLAMPRHAVFRLQPNVYELVLQCHALLILDHYLYSNTIDLTQPSFRPR